MAGFWKVGTLTLTREQLLAMAARIEGNAGRKAPAQISSKKQEDAVAENAVAANSQRGKFRGLTEADIRADLDQVHKWWGGDGAAAKAAGLARSIFGNARTGHAVIGETVMSALYGPAPSTTLQPWLKPKEIPAQEIAVGAGEGVPCSPEPGGAPAVTEGVGDPLSPAPSTPAAEAGDLCTPVSADQGEPDTSAPGDGADVTHEEPSGDAVAASDPVEAAKPNGPDPLGTDTAQSPVGSVTSNPLQAHIAKVRELAAAAERVAVAVLPAPAVSAIPAWLAPEDRDLVAILRAKLERIAEDDAANERRWEQLHRERDALQALRLELEVRRDALARTIKIFEAEEGTDDGQDSQQAEAAE